MNSRSRSKSNNHRYAASKVIILATVMWLSVIATETRATWSIVIVDTKTREIAVGSATCLDNFDLQHELPVVIVDVGAACAQSMVDVGTTNRMFIHGEMLQEIRPEKIIEKLATLDSAHEQRQYGLVNALGRSTTFTGISTGAYAGGLTGISGDLVYAIQGNVITGEPVLLMAEQAIINTAGGLPEKLMASMQAARSMGGDGRCSCNPASPSSCGSPPAEFEKSAHIGFMVVTRTGDTDGDCVAFGGCATGDYYMNFNVAFQNIDALDPVLQMQAMFDTWRKNLIGKTDAVISLASLDRPAFLADGNGSATMTIALRDYQDSLVDGALLNVTVEHASDSDQTTMIGEVIHDIGPLFHVDLIGSDRVGVDRFVVTVNDGIRPVILLPQPTLVSHAHSDQDRDGDVDPDDYNRFNLCMDGPDRLSTSECDLSDFDENQFVDLRDFSFVQREYTDKGCVELQFDRQPQGVLARCGFSFAMSATVFADPPPVYQWLLNGKPVPGANNSVYRVISTGNEDGGFYKLRVTNTCGSIESDEVLYDIVNGPCP